MATYHMLHWGHAHQNVETPPEALHRPRSRAPQKEFRPLEPVHDVRGRVPSAPWHRGPAFFFRRPWLMAERGGHPVPSPHDDWWSIVGWVTLSRCSRSYQCRCESYRPSTTQPLGGGGSMTPLCARWWLMDRVCGGTRWRCCAIYGEGARRGCF